MKKATQESRQPVAHPYARISDPTQRKGGGLDRQTSADISVFCKEHGFVPAKRTLVDDGVSAFRGLNATPEHELGKFLLDAQKGLIPPGDCLLLENYDRLSRQNPWAAISLVNDLRNLGIHVGRLDRGKLLRCDSVDTGDFFECAIELIRGHSESTMKSWRNSKRWKEKRDAARKGNGLITGKVPAWIAVVDGKLVLVPHKADIIQRIFQLAASGYGAARIVKRMIDDTVQPIGRGKHWSRSYVNLLLSDKRVMGEFQPRKIDGSKDGHPIPHYYPAAVTEEQYYAAQTSRTGRSPRPGRLGTRIGLFSGLIRDARDGLGYYTTTRTERGKSYRVLINTSAAEGRAACVAFPLEVFERAIFACLQEVAPHEILGSAADPDETVSLASKLASLEAREAELEAELLEGNVPALARALRTLAGQKQEVASELASARERAAHPLSETWGECQSLLITLESAADPADARIRLRAAFRRIIESIWILVVPRGRTRLCAVQIYFEDTEQVRSYLIIHKPAKANASARQDASWACRSFEGAHTPESFDLRNRKDAATLESLLRGIDCE